MVAGKVLVLGGIRSGKSAYAESLLDDSVEVVYVATAGSDDPSFAERIEAHRFRRPASWKTVEAAGDPEELIEIVSSAGAGSALLIDDLGGWATDLLGHRDSGGLMSRFAEAVGASHARMVLVSPEVGLSVVPPTEAGVEFADLVGRLNQSVATACDSVALVVAGQPTWLKQQAPKVRAVTAVAAATGPGEATPPAEAAEDETAGAEATTAGEADDALREQTRALPVVEMGMTIAPGMDLPIHDDDARSGAQKHLEELDIQGAGLGALARTVVFAAGTQSRSVPQAWEQPHMLLLHGVHAGDVAAGEPVAATARTARAAERSEGAIGLLAAWNGVKLKVVEAPAADDIVYGMAATPQTVEAMLTEGLRLADEAVDSGADLLILGSCGSGAQAAAAAIVARLTGAEIATLLARIVGPDGTIDDGSWMLRCGAVRDALHRIRNLDLQAKTLLSQLGGADLALATGVILGATARRTPVLMDGPVAAAAGLLARDLGSQSRLWCTLPDHSGHPTTKAAADVLGLEPLLDLKTDLGEGAVALLSLPLLRAGLHLGGSLATRPVVLTVPPGLEDAA